MRIVSVLGIRHRQEIGGASCVERLPVGALVGAFEYAAARHADVEMPRVARIDVDRVQLGPIGRAVLLAAGPLGVHRVIVETRKPAPRCRRRPRSETALAAKCRHTRRSARSRGRASARRCDRRRGLFLLPEPSGTPAAWRLPSRSRQNRWSGTRSDPDARCARRRAAFDGRADRAPCDARYDRRTSALRWSRRYAGRIGLQDERPLAGGDQQRDRACRRAGRSGFSGIFHGVLCGFLMLGQ